MTASIKTSIFLAAVSAVLLSCGGDSPAREDAASENDSNSGPTFLEKYIASQNLSTPAKRLSLVGEWSGLLYCGGRDFPIEISIDSPETAGIAIAPMIGKEAMKTPLRMTYSAAQAKLSVQDDTRSFYLKTEPTPESVSLQITGILDPQTTDMALIHPFEMRGKRRARACDFGVIARNDAVNTLEHMKTVLTALYGRRKPVLNQDCPPAYKAWLDDAVTTFNANPRMLDISASLHGQIFERTFGVPYAQADAQTLEEAGRIMAGSCVLKSGALEDRTQKIYEMRIASSLYGHKSYQAYRHAALKRDIGGNWLEWISAEVGRKAPVSRLNLASAAAVPRTFQFAALGLDTDQSLARDILSYSAELGEDGRIIDFLQTIEGVKDDFKGLLAKHQIAQMNEGYDANIAAQALDDYLLPAAKTYTQGARDVRSAVYMATWAKAQSSGAACPAQTPGICAKAAKLFEAAARQAAEAFIGTVETETQALYAKNSKLPGLRSSIAAEAAVQGQYGVLFESEAFEDVREDLTERRHTLQKRLRKDLVRLAQASNTAPQLNGIKTAYFLADDLKQSAMKEVLAAINETLESTSPFKDMFGAEYFNALYNRDFQELRRLDTYYMQSIRPLMDFGSQQAAAFGPLLDAISGSPEGTTQRDIQRSVANLSALYPILGTYLVQYQNAYKSCLAASAVTYRISKRTDMVTTDGFGREIRRTRGWTQDDDYTINKEFAQNFDQLFGTATSSGSEQLFDMFLNDGRITRLRSTVSTVMGKYKCSSNTIQQLERGMLAYDRDVTQRMRGR